MKSKEIVSLQVLLAKGRKALAAFDEAVATDTGDKKSRDSLLLSFVFTFEIVMNCLHAALSQRGMQVPDYAVAILRGGFQAELIDDPTGWDALRQSRNDISHAYDEALAVAIAASVRQSAAILIRKLLTRLERDD
ncbi:MAG: nucleotidyltransferase substrate binding protein [Rhodoferax sp.]|nr:nucleotidyltransferase substrate binding protein [Rhodoferax sp.]